MQHVDCGGSRCQLCNGLFAVCQDHREAAGKQGVSISQPLQSSRIQSNSEPCILQQSLSRMG